MTSLVGVHADGDEAEHQHGLIPKLLHPGEAAVDEVRSLGQRPGRRAWS